MGWIGHVRVSFQLFFTQIAVISNKSGFAADAKNRAKTIQNVKKGPLRCLTCGK